MILILGFAVVVLLLLVVGVEAEIARRRENERQDEELHKKFISDFDDNVSYHYSIRNRASHNSAPSTPSEKPISDDGSNVAQTILMAEMLSLPSNDSAPISVPDSGSSFEPGGGSFGGGGATGSWNDSSSCAPDSSVPSSFDSGSSSSCDMGSSSSFDPSPSSFDSGSSGGGFDSGSGSSF